MNLQQIMSDLRARGWTQKRLAARLDISQSHVSEIASGQCDPRLSVALAIQELHERDERPATEAAVTQ